jgi:photosynthetic reaction center cytochrome c subunit
MIRREHAALVAALPILALAGCELGPKQIQQTGYRGTGMEQIHDVSHMAKAAQIPPPPYELPPDGGPTAAQTYQNVQVLGNMSADRFNHLMAAITQWVAPEQGCNYCHNPENLASDQLYTKHVARNMLRMTLAVNGNWASHVKATGVTCYTCHRGNNIPQYYWSNALQSNGMSIRGNKRGQNTPDPNVGYASLPYAPFQEYFAGNAKVIRVQSDSPYPGKNPLTTRHAEDSYGIMMHVSKALGVNCTYCHNSQSFRSWSLSRAQRATAWYGIRMVRDINVGYIAPLQGTLPANRHGPMGDPFKVNCLTCHQGQSKPLGGQSMIADYPYLRPTKVTLAQAESGAAGVPAAMANPTDMAPKTAPPNAAVEAGDAKTPAAAPN